MPDNRLQSIAQTDVARHNQESESTRNDKSIRVVIHNDEVTPYEYVIQILGGVFLLSEEIADHIAWTAHTQGRAVVVVRPRVEAEKLVKIAHSRAQSDGYPLTFSLESE